MKAVIALVLILVIGQKINAAPRADSYFSANYEQSRERFRKSCIEAANLYQGKCASFKVPSKIDDDLTIDYGIFGSVGNNLVVIQSGVHGPEGYAGAAAERLFLEKYLGQFVDKGIDVVIIHALNPFGYKYGRRADEDNVNINRNFSDNGTIYSTKNNGYNALRPLFEPPTPVQSVTYESLSKQLQFIFAYVISGFDKRYINQAMNAGQFEHEQGLNYGGRSPQVQQVFLNSIIGPVISSHSGDVLVLDFHTGLGENGVLHVMNGLQPSRRLFEKMKGILGNVERQGIKLTDANAQDPDFFTDLGDVIDFYPTLSLNPEKVLAVTMEYGTMGTDIDSQLKSASRIIIENQAYFKGCSKQSTCAAVKRNFVELFNPIDDNWKSNILGEAELAFTKIGQNFF